MKPMAWGPSAALLAAALMAPGAAGAVTLDFDEVADAPLLFFNATPLTTRYADLGLLFSGTGAILNEFSDFEAIGLSPPNRVGYAEDVVIDFDGVAATGDVGDVLRFSVAQDAVSFLAASGTNMGTLAVRGFDAAGMEVAFQSIMLQSMAQLVSLGGGFTRLEFGLVDPLEGEGFVIDDLTFTQGPAFADVPAPAAFALFGLGLLAVAGVRRTRD